MAEQEPMSGKTFSILLMFVIIIGASLALMTSGDGGSKKANKPEDYNREDFTYNRMCKNAIKEKANYPENAEVNGDRFAGTKTRYTLIGNAIFKNAFGVAERYKWRCEINRSNDTIISANVWQ